MNSADAIEFIQNQSDETTLARLKEMEEVGKNRKTVIEALLTKCDSL